MGKAYWVATYRSVSNPDALAEYAKLSGPAIIAAGGRILVRGLPAHVYEAGLAQRTVVIEFDSVEQAKAAHDGKAYQEALAALAAEPSGTSGSSRRRRPDAASSRCNPHGARLFSYAARAYFRWAEMSLFISNMVALSLPNTSLSWSSARISRLFSGFCSSCLRM